MTKVCYVIGIERLVCTMGFDRVHDLSKDIHIPYTILHKTVYKSHIQQRSTLIIAVM